METLSMYDYVTTVSKPWIKNSTNLHESSTWIVGLEKRLIASYSENALAAKVTFPSEDTRNKFE
jgi:hypothetical protein